MPDRRPPEKMRGRGISDFDKKSGSSKKFTFAMSSKLGGFFRVL